MKGGDEMRLVDNLRKAEKKGAMSIRRGMERAREEWGDVERRIRQRMRIYPQKSQIKAAAVEMDETTASEANVTGQKPIVSIHGRDLREN
jgi:hypothetical protein